MHHFTFLVATIEGLGRLVVKPQFCKIHNFWNTDFSLRKIEKKSCNFWSFITIFMKSHTIVVKTLSVHKIMFILHFWVKYGAFEQTQLQFSKLLGFLYLQK